MILELHRLYLNIWHKDSANRTSDKHRLTKKPRHRPAKGHKYSANTFPLPADYEFQVCQVLAVAILPSMSGSNQRSIGSGTAKCAVVSRSVSLGIGTETLVQHGWTRYHRTFGPTGICRLGFRWRWESWFVFQLGVLISEKVFQNKRFFTTCRTGQQNYLLQTFLPTFISVDWNTYESFGDRPYYHCKRYSDQPLFDLFPWDGKSL